MNGGDSGATCMVESGDCAILCNPVMIRRLLSRVAAIAFHNPVSSNGTGLSFPHPAKTCTHAIMHAMHSLVGHAPECVVSHNSGQRWSSRTDDKVFSLRNIVCPRVDTSEDASRLHDAACCKQSRGCIVREIGPQARQGQGSCARSWHTFSLDFC